MRGYGNQIIFPQHDDRKIVPRAENNSGGIPLIRAATPIIREIREEIKEVSCLLDHTICCLHAIKNRF